MIVNGPGISFTEPDIGSEFVPPIPEHPREKIVALCEHCTNRLLGKKELKPFEYWAFAEVTTDEMADVLLKMKMRRPYTLADAVKATGMDAEPLEKLLDEMSYIGLLEYNWENPTRTKQWVLPMLVPGSAEFLNMRASQIEEHPAVAKFFEQASKGALARATPMVPPGGAGIGMHVIPVEQAIQMEDRSVSIEHIEHWLDKYDSFYLQMYQQVVTRAVAKECFTLMEVVSAQMEAACEMPKLVQEQKADGLIIIGRLTGEYLNFLNEKAKIPILYMDFCDEKADTDAVISDSYYGAYRMTNYLFDMGHREIAYVGTLLATGSITDRYLGYTKSLMEHGVAVRGDWTIADRDIHTGKIDMDRLLQLPKEMPTAFVCNCDLTASFLIRRLHEHGYRVPEDISVVGYDNYLFPGLCDVAITTYEVDMKEMARQTVHTLIRKMAGEPYRQGICIVEGHMVTKDSVKARKNMG